MIKPTYIGDGVYISANNQFPLIITTERHDNEERMIYFESVVLAALVHEIVVNHPLEVLEVLQGFLGNHFDKAIEEAKRITNSD